MRETSTAQVEGNINNHALKAQVPAPVEQGSFEHPCGLVVQDGVPPAGRDEFWQHDRSQLTIVMPRIQLIQVIQKRADDLAVR